MTWLRAVAIARRPRVQSTSRYVEGLCRRDRVPRVMCATYRRHRRWHWMPFPWSKNLGDVEVDGSDRHVVSFNIWISPIAKWVGWLLVQLEPLGVRGDRGPGRAA